MTSQQAHTECVEVEDTQMGGAPLTKAVSSVATSGPEVDSGVDYDSNGDEISMRSATQSVTSSIYQFDEFNGRTYHSYRSGKYLIPNDELEKDRLDLQNHIWLLTLSGSLHLAPFDAPPKRVLDIGCGTGIWAIEFAQKYPDSHVTGTDLSPIQPDFIPANCRFEIDDAEDEWMFSTPFDFIHGRTLMNCFKDISTVFESAFKNLAPGGIFEMQDGCMPFRCADATLEGTVILDWCHKVLSGSENLGRKWADPRSYAGIMRDVGFVDVTEQRFKWPLNTWPKDKKLKELGMWVREDMMEILPAVKKVFIAGHGWTIEEADAFVERAKGDLMNRKVHGWVDIVVVYGRKPL